MHPTDEELEVLLGSINPADRKRALQDLCALLESGTRIDLARSPRVARLILLQKSSTDVEVRRWLYKLLGLTQDRNQVAYLKGQVRDELDAENRRWAGAALVATLGLSDGRAVLQMVGVDSDEIERMLVAARYFRPSLRLGAGRLLRDLEGDDPLDLRWISLVYGSSPDEKLRGLIAELNTHEVPTVAEYSIWALVKDPLATMQDSNLVPQDIENLPPNVRRWLIQLAAKGTGATRSNWDMFEHASNDPDPRVREGAALGLTSNPPGREFTVQVADWLERESDVTVRRQIVRYLLSRRPTDRVAQRRLAAVSAALDPHSTDYAGLLPPRRRATVSRLFVHAPRRKGIQLLGIPRFQNRGDAHMVFIAVDTVDFSRKPDADQYTIAKQILDTFAHDEELSGLAQKDLFPLFTGDGLILAFRQTGASQIALRVVVRVRDALMRTSQWHARYGVHAGTAMIVEMTNESTQVVGHAINQAVRYMSSADPDEIVVSQAFYTDVLHDGREPTPGSMLTKVTSTDKHGNELIGYRVDVN